MSGSPHGIFGGVYAFARAGRAFCPDTGGLQIAAAATSAARTPATARDRLLIPILLCRALQWNAIKSRPRALLRRIVGPPFRDLDFFGAARDAEQLPSVAEGEVAPVHHRVA